MNRLIPPKLKPGDEIRMIAPSRSMSILSQELKDIAKARLSDIGFKLTFGQHVNESDDFLSSSIESRVEDLHQAFADNNVKAILTVIGGFNSNQLLSYLDWPLIQSHPKIFCGYSDITALNNAIFAKTGLVTYSGPHYSTFGQKKHFEYTLDYFQKCLVADQPYPIIASQNWTDDQWYRDQENRQLEPNSGYWSLNPGQATGTILGGNLCTFNLLQGSEFFPKLQNNILFIEDDSDTTPQLFDRDLQSLIHQPGFNQVTGLVIGRFQKHSQVDQHLLTQIIKSKRELQNIPVLANVDFGHTDPKITFPLGGTATLDVTQSSSELIISQH